MYVVTLDELIAAACELRAEAGGQAPVLMVTARGYATVVISEGLGFSSANGASPAPVVLVAGAGEFKTN